MVLADSSGGKCAASLRTWPQTGRPRTWAGRVRPCSPEIRGTACLRPVGTPENSPAFQRRDHARNRASPEGTAESRENDAERDAIQPSLRDLFPRPANPGVETPGYFRMSLRDAAVECPYGTKAGAFNPTNTWRRIRCGAFSARPRTLPETSSCDDVPPGPGYNE